MKKHRNIPEEAIITVAVGNAKSAGATLLALGDYAIAYPDAAIHFHGIRYGKVEDVTMEDASRWANNLRKSNDETAGRLVHVVIPRLAFHYSSYKDSFIGIREKAGNETLSDVQCFAMFLQQKVSYSGYRIIDKAITRFNAIQTLTHYVFPKLKSTNPSNQVKYESGILREIINFEIRDAKRNNRHLELDEDGISQVVADYLILREYHVGNSMRQLQNLSSRFGPAFLTDQERERFLAMSEMPKEEIDKWLLPLVNPRIKPFLYFTHSLCRHLQEEENPLTPRDAYWLGAVDEIMGSKLPCLRQVMENQRENPPETPEFPKNVTH